MNAKSILSRLRQEARGADAALVSNSDDPSTHISEPTTTDIASDSSGAQQLSRLTKLTPRSVYIDQYKGRAALEVNLLEDAAGLTASGTGATLWDCAIVLTQYLLSNHDMRGKKVLEIGAGLGLPSIALAMSGSDVVATERQITLNLLQINATVNCSGETQIPGSLRVQQLEWSSDSSEVINQCGEDLYDIIIGSDLIFPSNQDTWRSLAVTFRCLLMSREGKGEARHAKDSIEQNDSSVIDHTAIKPHQTRGFLAYENREDFVIQEFRQILLDEGVACTPLSLLDHGDCDRPPSDITIFELSITL